MRSWIRVRNVNSNLKTPKTVVDIHAVQHVTSQQNAREKTKDTDIGRRRLLATGWRFFEWCSGNGATLQMFGYPTFSDDGIFFGR